MPTRSKPVIEDIEKYYKDDDPDFLKWARDNKTRYTWATAAEARVDYLIYRKKVVEIGERL